MLIVRVFLLFALRDINLKTDKTMKKFIAFVIAALIVSFTYGQSNQQGLDYYNKGLEAYEQQNYHDAVYWFRKAAEQGYADAQRGLGVCYYNGEGVARDYLQAAYWFLKAAEQGDATAQCNLVVCYYNGYGVAQDYLQAVYWYRKAAEQGYAQAQYNLGYCYEIGYGVAQDDSQAVYWIRKAADQGYEPAVWLGY